MLYERASVSGGSSSKLAKWRTGQKEGEGVSWLGLKKGSWHIYHYAGFLIAQVRTYDTHGLARRSTCLLPFASVSVHVGMSVHVCACVCLRCGYVELMMLAYFINMNSVCVAYLSHHK